MVKQCIVCGKEFDASGNSVTCSSECSAENKRRYSRQWTRMARARMRHPKDSMKEIEQLSKIAREAGISYGELVRRMENV